MKSFLGLLTLLVSLQTASATSVMGTAIRFEKRAKAIGGVSHILSVYVDGSVVHRTLSPQLPNGMSSRLIIRLPAEAMDKIYSLIRRSRPVVVRFERSGVRCFAPASHVEKYEAANFSVFLREGAACDGGYKVNVKPAARKLTRVLDVLENSAHNKLATAEIERQVELSLN